MLKPTVGIESSLNSPAERTVRSVVFPLFWSPIRVIYPRSNVHNDDNEYLHFGAPEEGAQPIDKGVPPRCHGKRSPRGSVCLLSSMNRRRPQKTRGSVAGVATKIVAAPQPCKLVAQNRSRHVRGTGPIKALIYGITAGNLRWGACSPL